MLVNLVGEYQHLRMACQHFRQGAQFVVRVNAACGVRRRAEKHHTRFVGDGCFQALGANLEILFDCRWYGHRNALGKFYHFNVAYPCRGGDYHLVAGVDGREDDVAERLLGAARHYDLFGGERQTVFALHLLGDGFAQRHISCNRCVECEIVVDGFLGCLFDMLGRVEVRLSDRHIDNVYSLCFQFVALLRHC